MYLPTDTYILAVKYTYKLRHYSAIQRPCTNKKKKFIGRDRIDLEMSRNLY